MTDLDTLRPEVREAMHRLKNYLHFTIDGKHFRSEDYDTIRAELLRLAAENASMRAEAELAEAQNTIAAQQGTMGALKRKLALAEGELAALKARIAGAPLVEIANIGDPFIVLPDHLTVPNSMKGQRVRLVVEE